MPNTALATSGIGNLGTLLKRLEAATSRLEDMALAQQAAAQSSSAPPPLPPAAGAMPLGSAPGLPSPAPLPSPPPPPFASTRLVTSMIGASKTIMPPAPQEELDGMIRHTGHELDAVVVLTVDAEELVQRLLQRAETDGRSDDTEDVVRRRQEVYTEQTEPLIEVYRDRGLLVTVDGIGDVDEHGKLVDDDAGTYAVTKRDADAALASSDLDGMTRVLVRPPAILGSGETSVWNTLRPRAVRDGHRSANPEQTWSWVHVDDLAAFIADVATGAVATASGPSSKVKMTSGPPLAEEPAAGFGHFLPGPAVAGATRQAMIDAISARRRGPGHASDPPLT